MNSGIAFDETIRKFSIKAKDLSRKSGVSYGVISRFRSGLKSINSDSLERLLLALDDEAFSYFMNQLAAAKGIHQVIQNEILLQELVGHLNDVELSTLLHAVASKLRSDARTGILVST